MNNFASPKHIREMGEKYGIYANKNFGQNFLVDESILKKIVSSAELCGEDGVIEIGPGLGALTKELSDVARKVIAVEIDKKLIPVLNDIFEGKSNVNIVAGDILKLDINELINSELSVVNSISVVANLPYYITTPIIMKFLEEKIKIKQMVIMVQKEVADRMCAKSGGKEYGALSLAVQYYSDPEIVTKVDPHCFMPQPKVTSTVVRLKILDKPKVNVKDEKIFFKLISASFGQRRKTFVNSIYNSGLFNVTKDDICNMLEKMGINVDIRGEKLNLIQFAQISDVLSG